MRSEFKEDATDYFPIHISRDGVEIIVLWPGGQLGDIPVLDPAGIYLLPLTARFEHRFDSEGRAGRGITSEELVRKVANSGIFLADEIPGLRIRSRLRIHYVVDCRGNLRFTPLVSRSGIAVDGASVEILDLFLEGLAKFLTENLSKLLGSGVSKYFCSYYVASALEVLFDRDQMEKDEEKIVSGIMAIRHAYRVPFLLFKRGSELVLESWMQHDDEPIVVGRNVYNGLLRSVAFGLVDFPLPKEVVKSLPENFLLSMGAENVIYPMFYLSNYKPSAVQVHESSRGIFVKWETSADTKSFGGFWLLKFPNELSDVAVIDFTMASCLNSDNPAVVSLLQFASQMMNLSPQGGKPSRRNADDAERHLVRTLVDLARRIDRNDRAKRDDVRSMVRTRFERLEGWTNIPIPDELVDLLAEARIIRDDLWSYG